MVLYIVGAVVAAGLFALAVAPRKQGHNRPHITDLAANDVAYRAAHVTEAGEEVPSPVKTVA